MRVFDIVNGQVVIDPNKLIVPEFKTLWNRDKSKDKGKVSKELAYIVFMNDTTTDNPYRGFVEEERKNMLKQDFFNSTWEPDPIVTRAIEKFKLLSETTNTRLLQSAKISAEKLAKYFEQVDFTVMDSMGRPLYSARDLASNLSSVGNIVKSLSILEDQVRKEQVEASTVRGGSGIGLYEMPRLDMEYGD